MNLGTAEFGCLCSGCLSSSGSRGWRVFVCLRLSLPQTTDGNCLELATPKPDIPKLLAAFEMLAWALRSTAHAGVGHRATKQSWGASASQLARSPGSQCIQNTHKPALGWLLRSSESRQQLSAPFQVFQPNWTLSLFFHFSLWKDEFLHLVLILFLFQSCQNTQPGSPQPALHFFGGRTSNRTETPPALCHLPEPFSHSWASAGRIHPAAGSWRRSQACAPPPGPARLGGPAEQPSSSFIYNLLTTEWKLIEAAGSEWLPVCQHRRAAPLLTPPDRAR